MIMMSLTTLSTQVRCFPASWILGSCTTSLQNRVLWLCSIVVLFHWLEVRATFIIVDFFLQHQQHIEPQSFLTFCFALTKAIQGLSTFFKTLRNLSLTQFLLYRDQSLIFNYSSRLTLRAKFASELVASSSRLVEHQLQTKTGRAVRRRPRDGRLAARQRGLNTPLTSRAPGVGVVEEVGPGRVGNLSSSRATAAEHLSPVRDEGRSGPEGDDVGGQGRGLADG